MSQEVRAAVVRRYDGLAAKPEARLSCGGAADLIEAKEGDICADLGCGRGRDVLALATKVGPQGHVYGLDASPAMVAVATEGARERANVTVRLSELENLALASDSVDWVVSNCALNHATDKQQVWREIYRVLKPGGHFVVSDIFAVEPIEAHFRENPDAVAECWAGAETKPEYLAHVAEAGMVDVTIRSERPPYRKRGALLSSFTLSGRKPRKEVIP